MLASWGMHRMGKGGPKMQSFDTFHRSVEFLKDQISDAQKLDPGKIDAKGWALLEDIFHGINVMESGTSLVGNSKVMHHMMPDIVPPIDREYTLRYLRGNTNIRNDLDHEWQIMKGIIADFFIVIACHEEFGLMAGKWMANKDKHPWDTSVLKVVDNLVIGSKK